MKNSIWNILTGVVLLFTLIMVVVFAVMITNGPQQQQPSLPPTTTPIRLPTSTVTSEVFPPTWTPTSEPQETRVEGIATLRPTSTIAPTNTVFKLPTIALPTKTSQPVGCQVVSQEPKDGANEQKGAYFVTRWQLKNITQNVWRADSVDIRFISGDRVHTGSDIMDMPYDVGVGGILDLSISMHAPASSGSFTSHWRLVEGSTTRCNFFVTFKVP